MNGKNEKDVWEALRGISDPEVPVLSLVDLNIVRSVEVRGDEVVVEITPTFAGCPAIDAIAGTIGETLRGMGFGTVQVKKNYTAHWTTDSLSGQARTRLQEFGIAPPSGNRDVVVLTGIPCPYCSSTDTRVENPFGATLCKQLCYCNSCKQSFEQFRSV